ncbi:MAG TPA: zinc-ribbon domain-containing protein, partial [Ramlibacter sp.]|nr:zinc-ribbon domain-containing protein [Ramlibacter sp.]
MSLITSCPNCGTMFRVVADQLKISEGWVRCGHCSEVFDATAHLGDESVLPPVEAGPRAEDVPEPPPPEPPARPASQEARTAPAELLTAPAELQTRPADLHSRSAALESEWPSSLGPPSSPFPPDSKCNADSRSLEPSPLDPPCVVRA